MTEVVPPLHTHLTTVALLAAHESLILSFSLTRCVRKVQLTKKSVHLYSPQVFTSASVSLNIHIPSSSSDGVDVSL